MALEIDLLGGLGLWGPPLAGFSGEAAQLFGCLEGPKSSGPLCEFVSVCAYFATILRRLWPGARIWGDGWDLGMDALGICRRMELFKKKKF